MEVPIGYGAYERGNTTQTQHTVGFTTLCGNEATHGLRRAGYYDAREDNTTLRADIDGSNGLSTGRLYNTLFK